MRLRFRGVSPSEGRGLNVGGFDRSTDTIRVRRLRHLGVEGEGVMKTVARQTLVLLREDLAGEISLLCGLRDPEAPLLHIAEDMLRDNSARCLSALGVRHRSLY